MDIRFCEITKESIPDGEFEAGRAITVSGRSYYVSAALQRLMARSRIRGWVSFLLVLYAAGVVTFLLVTEMKREKPNLEAVSATQVAEMERRDGILQNEVTAALNKRLGTLESGLRADFKKSEAQRKLLHEAASGVAARIDKQNETIEERLRGIDARQSRVEKEIASVRDWILKLQTSADEMLKRQIDIEATQAKLVAEKGKQPPPTTDQPTRPGPRTAPSEEHEQQVTLWIERLKDKNNDLVFTATVKLADLKDLRATQPLIVVLTKHSDFYCRLGAATALGTLEAVDAVPSLIGALADRDELVRTAANEALIAITQQDFGYMADMSSNERKKKMKSFRSWFKANELTLRKRLKQEQDQTTGKK